MAEIIKPRDLNPGFLKNIESKYGEIDMVNDFFKPDLTTYYKATSINAEGSVTHKIIRLPSFGKLFSDLGKARNAASNLATNPDLRNDMNFQSQANDISNTFNSFRTFFRTNYPDQYQTVKNTLKEMSTSGAAGGYLTKYAFGKASLTPYIKMGYTPVNQKELRKKSKGIDYVDLHKK
tara:strand:+ start:883 stop:1416 length:534 start_codon:yes stop_codon:yes gene_type:complete